MQVDLYDNFKMLDNCTIARNAVIKWARENNIKNVVILDDDVSSFRYRYVGKDKKFHSIPITNIGEIFNIFIEFLYSDDRLECLSFGNAGGYFGGATGKFSKGFGRTCNQVFIMKIKDNTIFKATRSEDHIFSDDITKICLELYLISQDSSERGVNAVGGRINR